ncbi:hypothetical protein GCM10007094_23590 [Pseudovibrio japonicus]|uniref:Uncharacterized protein n=1 Tax=Pseudovibrio japonicus TaxID=366534 RepID=A0ABQ3EH52_9HYPH|nr:hypothetical protein [Pseudovibrio japonicus]GHB33936.1 hypothetical protein GCM10007094_23590 [Pseudovibrio japonicus]
MEYVDKPKTENAKWLRTALDKPLPETLDECGTEGTFDPWEDILTGVASPYNAEIESLVISSLKAIRNRKISDLLEGENALAAELMLHILADRLCDYGTSPRGAFPATGLEPMWQELIDKWSAYADVAWSDEPN